MNVYEARHLGRTYCCNTEGSEHYKEGGVEPIDLLIAKGFIEDFCIGNMIKYATRFKTTRNLVDLKKVSDYSHILCGVELDKTNSRAPTVTTSAHKPTQAEYEELFADEKPTVSKMESVEPVKEKYDGLSDEQLKSKIHFIINPQNVSDCARCPLSIKNNPAVRCCTGFMLEHPEEFRKIAIAHLEGLEGKA